MRQFLAILILINLLIFIWNYTFPYINPLVADYQPPPSMTALTLASTPDAPAEVEPASAAVPASEPQSNKTREDEKNEESNDILSPVAPASIEPKAAPENVFVCGSIGPMLNAQEQTMILSVLSLETRAELSVRVDRNKRDLSYWVMIPPLESLTEARAYMKILTQNSLNESFIVTEKSHRNAISLGVFREKERAERLLARTKDIALESRPKLVVRGSHDYWVDFKSEVSSDYYNTIGALLKQKRHLRHTEKECPD